MAERSNEKSKEIISNEEHGNGVNLIISLPDEIIIKILSLLPIVDAYSTSFVSREWRRVWKSIPVIDLTIYLVTAYAYFFSKLLLNFCDSESTVRSVGIQGNCYTPEPTDEVDYWIDFAAERCTQRLKLSIAAEIMGGGDLAYKLPPRFFECTSLREINLSGCELNLHGPVDFPSLHTLGLRRVVVDSPVINAVIAGSPRLNDLTFDDCKVHGGVRIEDSESHLSSLHVSPRRDNDGKFVIRVPKLDRFGMCSMPSDGVSVIGGLNLGAVRLQFDRMWDFRYDLADRHWHSNLVDLLSDLSHAGSLHLSSWSLQVFTIWGRENLGPSHAVRWENLVLDVSIPQWEIPGIVYLLKTFSPVKNLTINFVRDEGATQIMKSPPELNEDEFLRIERLPLASLQHLEIISLSGIIRYEDVTGEGPVELVVDEFLERRQHEIMLVKILLENSTALKKMTCTYNSQIFWGSEELYSEVVDALSEKMQAFPRASPAAEVILNYE